MTGRRKRSRTGPVKNRKTGVSDSCFISDLPINVSQEIFFKLPIKAVMRCKCVCTAWNNIISEPNFSKNYAKNSSFTSFFYDVCHPRAKYVSNMLEISENGACKRTPFNPILPGWPRGKQSVCFVGSCNGFLCIQEFKTGVEVVYVTNPVTGLTVTLPECERPANGQGIGVYQFGFSPSTNKFKVLRICYRCRKAGSVEICEIITVGVDDSWRHLPVTSFPGLSYFSEFLVFNGALHWIRSDKVGLISTFDLTDENFGQIRAPPMFCRDSPHVKLAVFGDQLCLVDSSAMSDTSIWKLKKYSVVENWTRVVVLPMWPPLEPGLIHPIPVAELQNGDVLVLCSGGCLMSYSIKHKKWYKIRIPTVGSRTSRSILTYTPNFSSPSELITRGHQNAANISHFSFFQGNIG